jgi:hypothetical protein
MDSITWEYVRYVATYEIVYQRYYSISSIWIIGDCSSAPLIWISLN